ncbi:MAG: cell division protein FtsZ [Pseudomonadota bacterium]
MTINLQKPEITELKPRITVFGVGGGGGNAVNNMIASGLEGVEFVVANTDAQALTTSKAERLIQMGVQVTEGLGAGSQPEVGAAAAQESIDEIKDHLTGTHMAFVTAGMGGGTGTGAAPVVAAAAREAGILTVGVVTKPFSFEGKRRMGLAEEGIAELQKNVDTLIVIPNQNLFRVANDKTTFADAFSMADEVLYSGVACITDLMVKEGLINLDFADVRSVMREMGRAMMGTGEASGEGRAMAAAEAAISNPLLDEVSMAGSQGLLISITGGRDMTLFELDEAATRIREEVDADANIILGATFDESLEGIIRVSVVATGIDADNSAIRGLDAQRMSEAAERLRQTAALRNTPAEAPAAVAKMNAEPVAPVAEVVRAAPFQADEDPISDAAFQAALESEIAIPAAPVAPAPKPAPMAAQPVQPAPRAPVATPQSVAQRAPVAQPAPVAANVPQEDAGAVGLLKRLANGFGSAPDGAVEVPRAPSAPAAPQPAPQNVAQAASPYAPPRANGTLDLNGRAQPAPAKLNQDEDLLDIPAFLRRQSN